MALALAGCAQGAEPTGSTVRFALDWTPNTNHTGLYVALSEGYFEDAGIDVEVLPYNETQPDQLIDAGNAEFGVSFHDASVLAQAGGADVISVMAPLQHRATAIGVRADDDTITRPRDLDGKTYAGFGAPYEQPALSQVIKNDGGKGDFETVTLGTSAYEALYSGKVDFTIPFLAWEGIEAEHNGTPMKYFQYTDFGFPDAYAIVIDANRDWLQKHPKQARAFVGALQKGYVFAADEPAAAARILVEANRGTFADKKLVQESQAELSSNYLKADDGTVGTQTLEQWSGYADFLVENGILTDGDGTTITERPDWSTYFTNDYLSK